MIVQPGGRSCPCGNHGCLEQYISEPAVLSRYRELSGRTTVSIDDLVWAYNQKETAALAVTDEFTTYLACGINNLWNLFSPECIILNSQLTAYLPQLLPEILQKLSPRFRATCQLKLSTLQDTGVLLGAAKVCISKYREPKNCIFPDYNHNTPFDPLLCVMKRTDSFFENTENYRFFSLHPSTGYPFIPASFRNILYTHPNKLSAHPGVPQRQLPLFHRYQP